MRGSLESDRALCNAAITSFITDDPEVLVCTWPTNFSIVLVLAEFDRYKFGTGT